MVNFNTAKKATENKIKNFNTPKALLNRTQIDMSDMIKSVKVVNIDYFAVRTQVKKIKNKDTGKYETVKTKDGREIMQGVIYIGFDKEYFTVTASGAMLSQIALLLDVDSVVATEPCLTEIPELCNDEGERPSVFFENMNVKYRDGKTYPQAVIATLE